MIPEELKRLDAEKLERKKQIQQMMKYAELLCRCFETLCSETDIYYISQITEFCAFLSMEVTSFSQRKYLELNEEYDCTCEEECVEGFNKELANPQWKDCARCRYFRKNQPADEAPKGGANDDN